MVIMTLPWLQWCCGWPARHGRSCPCRASRRPSCTSRYTGSSFPSRGLQLSPSASGYASSASTDTPSGDRGGRESTRRKAGRRRRATSRRQPRRSSSSGRDDVASRRQQNGPPRRSQTETTETTSLYSDEKARERGRVYVAARKRENATPVDTRLGVRQLRVIRKNRVETYSNDGQQRDVRRRHYDWWCRAASAQPLYFRTASDNPQIDDTMRASHYRETGRARRPSSSSAPLGRSSDVVHDELTGDRERRIADEAPVWVRADDASWQSQQQQQQATTTAPVRSGRAYSTAG